LLFAVPTWAWGVARSVAEVQDQLSLGEPPAVEAAASDAERLVEGLRHPAAQMSFAWIENNAELRRVIEGGDFSAWRVFLHPEQRKYARRSYSGPFRLSGGAGTGKTVGVLHRTRMLARRAPGARILVTTYTANLADQIRADLDRLDPSLPTAPDLGSPGVAVRGIDAIAYEVLRSAGADAAADAEAVLGVATPTLLSRTLGAAWNEALDAASAGLPAALQSTAFFAAEYSQVVLSNRITSREAYYKVRRLRIGTAASPSRSGGTEPGSRADRRRPSRALR
jgi:AAA domain